MFLNVSLINMVTILLMSSKLAALGLFKTKIFRNKVYDFLISVYDVTLESLSRDSSYL